MSQAQTQPLTWDQDTGEVLDEGELPQSAPLVTTKTEFRMPEAEGNLALMVQFAQNIARDPAAMIARGKQIGSLLGKKGFYRFPVKGKNVEGESVHLAQALAQAWGGIMYQTRIVTAVPLAEGGQRVHLRSSIADMKAVVCAELDQVVSTAPPPGNFAKDHEQRERWNTMQIQNAASKVVRNALLDVLPKWYTQPAFEAAKESADTAVLGYNADDTVRTLPQARAVALDSLTPLGCTKLELERHLEQPYDMWAVPQIGVLRELYLDLKKGRTTIEAFRQSLEPAFAAKEEPRASKSALGLDAKKEGKP